MKKKKLLTDRGVELHEGLEEEMAQVLREEIDREILFDLLINFGWTKIELSNKWLPVSGKEIHEWREKNLTGMYKAHENVWLFEKSEDAALFMLRWS